jgi:hypothetical protein
MIYKTQKFTNRIYIILLLFISTGFCFPNKIAAQRTQKIHPATKPNPNFLFFSDIHLNTTSDSTSYGSDTGMELWS